MPIFSRGCLTSTASSLLYDAERDSGFKLIPRTYIPVLGPYSEHFHWRTFKVSTGYLSGESRNKIELSFPIFPCSLSKIHLYQCSMQQGLSTGVNTGVSKERVSLYSKYSYFVAHWEWYWTVTKQERSRLCTTCFPTSIILGLLIICNLSLQSLPNGQQSTDERPTDGRLTAVCWPIVGRHVSLGHKVHFYHEFNMQIVTWYSVDLCGSFGNGR